MRDNLPSYSIPGTIHIIDAFPLSIDKKLDMKALAEITSNHIGFSRPASRNSLNKLQKQIVVALLEALDLPIDQICSPDTTY